MVVTMVHPAAEPVQWVRLRTLGERTAFVFLRDGEEEVARLTYAGLDRAARAIAARLLAPSLQRRET